MAQLRDAQTSEIIGEGTPIEMVTLAQQLGGDVLYDGVGEGFDPNAVLESHASQINGLESYLAEAPTDSKMRVQSQIDNLKNVDVDLSAAHEAIAEARKDFKNEPEPSSPPPVVEVDPDTTD